MSDCHQRAAKNQSLFREVNERVKEINDGHAITLALTDFVCECADETCTARIPLSPYEYERLREIPTHFAVAPGAEHYAPDVERIVKRHERYWVVEKIGQAGTTAERFDPRSEDAATTAAA